MDVIPPNRNKAAHTVRPESSQYTRSTTTPVIAGKHGCRNLECVHECKKIMSKRCLLA